MRKTSVYLNDEVAEKLQHLAVTTGKAQAELIREGIRLVIAEIEIQPRTFRSLGRGRGGGGPYVRWDSGALHDKVMGRK